LIGPVASSITKAMEYPANRGISLIVRYLNQLSQAEEPQRWNARRIKGSRWRNSKRRRNPQCHGSRGKRPRTKKPEWLSPLL